MPKKQEETQSAAATWTSNQIRQRFLDYFGERQHELVPSSSLVPGNDPTLLFTNAGMVQFKDVFLGQEKRPYKRAASSQRCVRAGGKHNDLENVGYTARHHTFFEMLGNFSFGDYFKEEAIEFAWNLLTQEFKLPKERLWITVYKDDKEAEEIWLKKIKIDPTRFSRCDEDNFWSMGPTGPCGPCTEIFYDHGPAIAGGPPGSPEADGDRYIEIWNLVFMQFNRALDGTLTPLPRPSIDTGMGLERITAVLQGVHNNYDTDLFQPLIKTVAQLAKLPDEKHVSLRVIADHIRSCAFLITDGVLPSNEGRGYVLRRIIRRALRHGHQLGLNEPFFHKLTAPLVKLMGEAYPELSRLAAQVEKTLLQEEEQFSTTLSQGVKLFDQVTQDLKGALISGETVFKLYDTYGFPVDLTADMARERGLALDYEGFEEAMAKQRERSRQASKFETEYTVAEEAHPPTEFVGYKNLLEEKSPDKCTILALYRDGKFVDSLKAGEKGSVILDRTPFYAESGGQIGDQGLLKQNHRVVFRVTDTVAQGKTYLHIGKTDKDSLHVGDEIEAVVDAKRRAATVLNHTATHLLHVVLRSVLGEHAVQKGSLVEPERLRFDFSHSTPLTEKEIQLVEQRVNEEIRSNHQALVRVTTPQEAIATGAMGLFEEKYGNQVRVVRFGPSLELCGGTHAERTGDLGLFKITSEAGIAAGVRRIEAVTGEAALRWVEQRELDLKQKNEQMEEKLRLLEKQSEYLKEKLAHALGQDLLSQAYDHQGLKIVATTVTDLDTKAVRILVDQLKNKLGLIKEDKVSVIAGITKNECTQLKANELVNQITSQLNGKGGGRADLAEGGGVLPSGPSGQETLKQILKISLETWLKQKLQ
jgi:alanyl-tRNA synthetase